MLMIYGASDDLIELSGDISDEFDHGHEEPFYMAFSDGTVLSVVYTPEGSWRINRAVKGTADYTKFEAVGDDAKHTDLPPELVDEDPSGYSDVVILNGASPITWVVGGTEFRKQRASAPAE